MRAARGEHAQLPALHLRQRDMDGKKHHLHLPAEQVGHGTGGSLVWHVQKIDIEMQLEQFHRQVMRRAAPRRRIIELAGLSLRQGDELLHRRGWHRRMDDERQVADSGRADRSEALHRVVGNTRLQCGVGHVSARGHEQGITVGQRLARRLGADIAARPRAVVDHHRDLQPIGKFLADDARQDVDAGAWRVRHDDTNRPVGIGRLRRCGRDGKEP